MVFDLVDSRDNGFSFNHFPDMVGLKVADTNSPYFLLSIKLLQCLVASSGVRLGPVNDVKIQIIGIKLVNGFFECV